MDGSPNDQFLADLSQSDYSMYGLKVNPFPSIGIPEEVPATTADREEPKRKFKEALRRTIFEHQSSIMVVTGDYGAGKTHLLRYFKYSVNANLSSNTNKVLAVYIKTVGLNFRDFYLNFVDEMGRDFLSGFAVGIIKSYVKGKGDAAMRRYVYGADALARSDITESPVSALLTDSRYLDLFHDIQRDNDTGSSARMLNVVLHLAHPQYAAVAWRWLLGEKFSKDEMQLINVDFSIDDDRAAMAAFQDMISLILFSHYTTLVLLIDEFENLTLIPTQTRYRYMEEIRQFIDENPGKLVTVFATTPGAYVLLTQVPSALQRRLSGTEVDLGFFELRDIRELITLYLALGRIKNADIASAVAGHPGTSVETWPFTEQAVAAALGKSRGLVSSAIKICRESLEMAVEARAHVIGPELVDRVKL